MSGTSLDGVDLAYVEFMEEKGKWRFDIGPYESIVYSSMWKTKLHELMKTTSLDFVKTHVEYGHLIGGFIRSFVEKFQLKPDIIGVHGHTIFHDPNNGYTSQIGDGAAMAAVCNQLIACDFRSMDVARGGQGAPLVPIGDDLLFSQYEARLNIGGFANISYRKNGKLIAYDICPANIVLNQLAQLRKLDYDDRGQMASTGITNEAILEKLNNLSFYHKDAPKSLGKEWSDFKVLPLLLGKDDDKNLMRTMVEHISDQISEKLNNHLESGEVLVSGGGAYNDFLINRLQTKVKAKIVIPQTEIIEMKEAVIFAFLGVLRMLNRVNIYSDITGSVNNSISGALYNGKI